MSASQTKWKGPAPSSSDRKSTDKISAKAVSVEEAKAEIDQLFSNIKSKSCHKDTDLAVSKSSIIKKRKSDDISLQNSLVTEKNNHASKQKVPKSLKSSSRNVDEDGLEIEDVDLFDNGNEWELEDSADVDEDEPSLPYGIIKSRYQSKSQIVNPEAPLERIDKESGLPVYKAHLLRVGEGGGTPLCPFDCNCCF